MTTILDNLERLLREATKGPVYASKSPRTSDRRGPDDLIWTVGPSSAADNWETDSGCNGYGISKADADLYAALRNAAPHLLALAREVKGLLEDEGRPMELKAALAELLKEAP